MCASSGPAPRSPASRGELMVRGGLGAAVAVPACAAVATQYVDSAYGPLVSILSAAAVAEAVLRAAGRPAGVETVLVAFLRVLAVAAAVLATAASFTFGPGDTSLVTPAQRVLPSYAVSVVAAVAWTRTWSPTERPPGQDAPTWRRSGSAAEQEGPTT